MTTVLNFIFELSSLDEWQEACCTQVVPAAGRLVACLGVDDVVVVDTPDALLASTRARPQEVKKVVKLSRNERVEVIAMYEGWVHFGTSNLISKAMVRTASISHSHYLRSLGWMNLGVRVCLSRVVTRQYSFGFGLPEPTGSCDQLDQTIRSTCYGIKVSYM